MNKIVKDSWLRVVAILFLGLIVVSYFSNLYILPITVYQLMSWAVTLAAGMLVLEAKKQDKSAVMWFFVMMIVFFNPLAPIYLGEAVWPIVDIVAILAFVGSFFVVRD